MRFLALMGLGIWIGLAGCAGKGGKPGTPGTIAPPPDMREQLMSHAEGTWETTGKDGKTLQAVFAKGGRLTFKNALESYNPAVWSINEMTQELVLTFSSVSLEAMQIFQLYVGQGVKSFSPQERKVTYAFTPNIWSLNIGGWEYSKPDTKPIEALPPEPYIR